MATYLFVPGAWHGSWCWSEVRPLLHALGHRVLTPDLVGTGPGDATAIVHPLAVWADQIADILRIQDEPVVLVGHSRAGAVISEVAERIPERIDLLVYLCAFLLQDGQTVGEVARQADNAEGFFKAVTVDKRGLATFDGRLMKDLLFNTSTDPLVQIARSKAGVEPAAMLTSPIHVTPERFGTVRRSYIECLDDKAIPIAAQRAMQEAVPVALTRRLDCDHSPFFSMPAELVKAFEALRTGK